MKKKQSFVSFLLLFALLLAIPVRAEGARGWYIVKNKEHRQPPLPHDLALVREYGGVYLDPRHGDGNPDKVVYLTFDAGYENGNVKRVLDALDAAEATGAFFLLRHFVTENPDLVLRMKEKGHFICNHTASHKNLTGATREEIAAELASLDEAVKEVTGEGVRAYFRPPEGAFSRSMMEHVASLGYRTVFWSFAYADWDNKRQPDPERALAEILSHVHNGAVLLLHPTSATNAAILPELLSRLQKEGYRFGTLDELCIER